ncbi:hypothetical protein L1077_17510 [Pseudoalteromonas luteoviolacea]|uniref:hypothetical protein n=1 Tax=Pseudoalteromonas luteoviolacea TaxID=43657 RepID=UPI001F342ACB|nr:hypothetical protein [Pseudoalteromonas luteoviolacea]MCF6441236.1 hypothetical protein [Pseudoalteromonas luteoviolacea]
MNISRRQFIKSSMIISSLPLSLSLSGCTFSENPFGHGVASGDPLSDSVIL